MREAGLIDRILFTIGWLKAVRVSGDSMRPTLGDGDVVLIVRTRDVGVDDIVLAAHPFKSSVTVLKRVVAIDDAERVELRGDDPDESSDSRSFGNIRIEDIRGKVICRLSRARRT
jgi:nickel-type superoxide dismutase maturation protease